MLVGAVGEWIENVGSDVGGQFVVKDAREELYTYSSVVNDMMLDWVKEEAERTAKAIRWCAPSRCLCIALWSVPLVA